MKKEERFNEADAAAGMAQKEDGGQITDLEQLYLDQEQEKAHNYIKEIVEHQNNQLNPGYYIGTGRVSPGTQAAGNALLPAIWMAVQAVVFILIWYFFIFSDNVFTDSSSVVSYLIITAVFLLSAAGCFWLSVVYFKKAKRQREAKKQFELSDVNDGGEEDGQMVSVICPECGEHHDMDFPKCPFCKHSYIGK